MLKQVLAAFLTLTLWTLCDTARAQQADPRLAGPLIQALQSQVALQQAMLKVQGEDAEAQKKTLWDWLVAARAEAEAKK